MTDSADDHRNFTAVTFMKQERREGERLGHTESASVNEVSAGSAAGTPRAFWSVLCNRATDASSRVAQNGSQ